MSEHEEINTLLPLFVSGRLDETRRQAVNAHLKSCATCRSDLAFWQAIAQEVSAQDAAQVPSPAVLGQVLQQVHTPQGSLQTLRRTLKRAPRRAFNLLTSQVPLIRHELWLATGFIMLIGVVAGALFKDSGIIAFLAPLIAAASVSMLLGPENDLALELEEATPTSPRQILLARLTLVFGYDFFITLVASLVMAPLIHGLVLLPFILSWLAPMAFLSAFALLLSLLIRAENAIALAYLAWLIKLLAPGISYLGAFQSISLMSGAIDQYSRFWQDPRALLFGAVLLTGLAIWLVGKQDLRQSSLA